MIDSIDERRKNLIHEQGDNEWKKIEEQSDTIKERKNTFNEQVEKGMKL